MQNHLLDLLGSLSERKIEFIVGGGVALALHGIERATMDLDISVNMTQANLSNFIQLTKELGLKPRVPVAAEALLDPCKVQMMVKDKGALVFTFLDPDQPFKQVDVFLTKDHSYEILLSGSIRTKLGNHWIQILSPKQLIGLKQKIVPPREKDVFDINQLEKLLGKK